MAKAWCGAVLVAARDERVEARLSLQHIRRCGVRRLFLQRQVHPLVSPVLLRVAGAGCGRSSSPLPTTPSGLVLRFLVEAREVVEIRLDARRVFDDAFGGLH